MYGFSTVADWCADHDVWSCENDALEACKWVDSPAAAATTTTAADDSYDDYYYDDYAYDSYSYDSYSYDSYDSYSYDSYGYDSYSYDSYSYDSSSYTYEMSETVAGFDLDLGDHGVWCDFVVEYDYGDEMYNLECHPWEDYDDYYDPYYYDSYEDVPEGTVLCEGNDSGAYCDLSGDCLNYTWEYCWCDEAQMGCMNNGYSEPFMP